MKNTSTLQANVQGILQPVGFPGFPEGWTADMETYPSADGSVQLFGALYQAPERGSSARHRALVISHGIGEHGGRYLHFTHYLRGTVDSIYAGDHRGHGRSGGLRGHVDSFDLYVEDLKYSIRRLNERLTKRHGHAPEIHLFGHSMGSLIALRAALSDPKLPVVSLILSSPLLGIRVEVPAIKRIAANALSKVWGSLQMNSELDVTLLSHDPEVARAYVADRLVHQKITPKLFLGMMAAMKETGKNVTGLHYPVLMLVPGDDRITDGDLAQRYFEALKMPKGQGQLEKAINVYPGFYHESFNEVGKEKVFEDLHQWLSQIPRRS